MRHNRRRAPKARNAGAMQRYGSAQRSHQSASFGAAPQNGGDCYYGDLYQTPVQPGGAGCAPNAFYSLPGNAGLPGCGVGTLCGSECHYQILSRVSRAVPVNPGTFDLEISALRAGAFKPRFVYMFGIEDADTELNARFEITSVEIQGLPQLIQTQGDATGNDYVVLIDAFLRPDHPLAVSWMVFGSDAGQTMRVQGVNATDAISSIYVILWGDAAETSMIGSY